jgi:hypothetical protein
MSRYLTEEELKAAYIKAQASRETKNFPLERIIADAASDKGYAEAKKG